MGGSARQGSSAVVAWSSRGAAGMPHAHKNFQATAANPTIQSVWGGWAEESTSASHALPLTLAPSLPACETSPHM